MTPSLDTRDMKVQNKHSSCVCPTQTNLSTSLARRGATQRDLDRPESGLMGTS